MCPIGMFDAFIAVLLEEFKEWITNMRKDLNNSLIVATFLVYLVFIGAYSLTAALQTSEGKAGLLYGLGYGK